MKIGYVFKRLGDYRDGMLVGVTAVYVLGYLNWTFYAWRYDLGVVSAFDLQYFSAGAPIAAVLVGTAVLLLSVRQLGERSWGPYFERQTPKRRALLSGSLIFIILVFIVVSIILAVSSRLQSHMAMAVGSMFVSYVLMYTYGSVIRPDYITRFFAPAYLMFLAIYSAGVYASAVYETVPDTLGGGRARYVMLDVKADTIAPETLGLLLGVPPRQVPRVGVIRINSAWLIPSPSDFYLLLPANKSGPSSTLRIQLRKGSVTALAWNRQ